jgi:hypothetical protein
MQKILRDLIPVDNRLKLTLPGGSVRIEGSSDATGVPISVADTIGRGAHPGRSALTRSVPGGHIIVPADWVNDSQRDS